MTSQTNPASGAREVMRRHLEHSRQYLENGLALLQKGEAGKAGELLWGSVTQAVHAVAASRGVALTNHRSLRYFVNQLARELRDPEVT